MVLITDFVLPRTESAPGENILLLQVGENLVQSAVALQAGGGVSVVETAHVGADDLVLGLKQRGVDQALDAVGQQGVVVNRLILRLGNFQHDRPVWSLLGVGRSRLLAVGKLLGRQLDILLRLVVGGVVGEDGSTVEGAVVFGEVKLQPLDCISPWSESRENIPSIYLRCAQGVSHGYRHRSRWWRSRRGVCKAAAE